MKVPAFPIIIEDRVHASGLTKREYFAARALVGILGPSTMNSTFEDVAIASVRMADALIAELAKPQTDEELQLANERAIARLENEGLV